MTDLQFEEVELLLRKDPKNSSACPTCGARAIEPAPGIVEWGPSTYKYAEEEVPCNCEKQRALFRHYLLAHIPEEYMRLNGEDDYWGDRNALTKANEFLDNWENNRIHGIGLGFYSTTLGTGKTFLSTYVGRELIKRGESVFYIPFLSTVNLYELPHDERKHEEDILRNCTVLILDEVVKPISDAQQEFFAGKLEELIRHRSNYNRVTVMTTNLEPTELDRYYPRTFSLLSAKQERVEVSGSDIRKEIWDINKTLAENGEVRPIS